MSFIDGNLYQPPRSLIHKFIYEFDKNCYSSSDNIGDFNLDVDRD